MPGRGFQTFDRDVQLATAGIAPEAISRELARFAKDELAKVIAAGEASTIFTTYVNGKRDVPVDSVVAPGPVLYEFSYWQPILEFTMTALKKRSPVLTSRYQKSHVIMIGSQVITSDVGISAGEEVTVVSTVPYARVLEVGNVRVRAPGDGIYQAVRQQVQRQYGKIVDIKFRMVTIPGGYRLKGRFRQGYKAGARKKLRPDAAAGVAMTYPALVMNMR